MLLFQACLGSCCLMLYWLMLNTKIHSSYNYDTFVENVKLNLGSIHEWLAKNELKPHSGKKNSVY